MRRFFSFWWQCAKLAFRGNSAFANDWQWVFGIPLFSGISIWANAKFGDGTVSTGSPVADGFLGALGAFVLTWLVAYTVRIFNARMFSKSFSHKAVDTLRSLEGACEALAAQRSQTTYHSMLNDGSSDALLELDRARMEARKVIESFTKNTGWH